MQVAKARHLCKTIGPPFPSIETRPDVWKIEVQCSFVGSLVQCSIDRKIENKCERVMCLRCESCLTGGPCSLNFLVLLVQFLAHKFKSDVLRCERVM